MNVNLIGSVVDYGILGLLLVMAFLSLFFWIERVLFFKSIDVNIYDTIEELELDLTNNISVISSFAANAPYIGLLGTVLSIIITFYQISINHSIETSFIMSSLSLALKSTAMGLVVAIPAIFFYNHLDRKIEIILNRWIILRKKEYETKI